MTLIERFRTAGQTVKTEVAIHRLILEDPRVPRLAKWLLGLAVAYALSPIDLIPDFIPVLGYVDDLVILPALVGLALKLVPQEVITEARNAKKGTV